MRLALPPCLLLSLLTLPNLAADDGSSRKGAPTDIGARRELFVDRALIAAFEGKARLLLHHPKSREVALTFDRPWEGNASGYTTVFQDGKICRMYYRGHRYVIDPPPLRQAQPEVVCYAESRDGIHWVRPNLGLFDWKGSKKNNIIWRGGPETHNFAPFKDANPDCKREERYKAVGGTVASKGLLTFKSADGIHWSRMSATAVVTRGAFDSHNTAFWDVARKRYCMYTRYFSKGKFRGLRSIAVSYSTDFKKWTAPVPLTYPGSPDQQMYTNQVAPYFRAPHLLFGFPTRYVARRLTPHAKTLPPVAVRTTLTRAMRRIGSDLTDGLFMTSRDGRSFHRWDEAFLRPGRQEAGRWLYGDNYQCYGLFETRAAKPGAANEISMLFTENAWRDPVHRLRRYSIRPDGFVSLYAPYAGGGATTRPLTFRGGRLSINYSTSAAGSVRVEIQDAAGKPLKGFSLADANELYGDTTDQTVSWKNGADVGQLAGKPVRLRFILRDADLYSYRFVPVGKTGKATR